MFKKIAQNATSWGNERNSYGKANVSADNEVLKALTQQVSMLTSKLERLNSSAPQSTAHIIQHCEVCGSKNHGYESCSMQFPQEEVSVLYGNTYNPNFKHPNISCHSQNVLNPQPMVQKQQFRPPGYQQKPYPPRPQFQNIAALAPPHLSKRTLWNPCLRPSCQPKCKQTQI